MFAAVNSYVPPGQIVVFFRPRALNLFTDRDGHHRRLLPPRPAGAG